MSLAPAAALFAGRCVLTRLDRASRTRGRCSCQGRGGIHGMRGVPRAGSFRRSCILWQRYVRLWSRNLRSLSGACFLRASVQGTSVARHQIDSLLYETDDKTGDKPAREHARVCWKLVQACEACCAPGFPAGRGEVVVLRAQRRTLLTTQQPHVLSSL